MMIRQNTSGPVRVGVVGMGWFGRVHLDAWASVRGARVIGVCDRDHSKLADSTRAAQSEFHNDAGGDTAIEIPPEVMRVGSVSELIAAGIDLLDVVVTEDQHEQCVREALNAGVDVVVEKPLALTAAAARDLMELAHTSGRHLYVGHVLRFDPRYVTLAEQLAGAQLRHMSLSRHFQTSAHDVYGRAHPVLNACVHDIDVAVWLAGGPPSRVTGFASHWLEREQPDCVDLVLEWESGLRAVVQNSWHLAASCPYGFVFDTVVHAADETYTVRNTPVVEQWTSTKVTAPELFFWPHWAGVRGGALVAELQHFTDCAAGGQPTPRVPPEQALAVMETCEAAMKALATGAPQLVDGANR